MLEKLFSADPINLSVTAIKVDPEESTAHVATPSEEAVVFEQYQKKQAVLKQAVDFDSVDLCVGPSSGCTRVPIAFNSEETANAVHRNMQADLPAVLTGNHCLCSIPAACAS